MDVSDRWWPRFPMTELVHAAADLLPTISETPSREAVLNQGPRWEIVVSPASSECEPALARAARAGAGQFAGTGWTPTWPDICDGDESRRVAQLARMTGRGVI
jgi:hypothetical protein